MSIHSYITEYVSKDYGGVSLAPGALNCALGVSDRPLPPGVIEALGALSPDAVKQYPHNEAETACILDALIARFSPAAPLRRENFAIGGGSFDLLCSLNLLYAGRGRKLLCHAPQFTAYIDHAHCIGSEVCTYRLEVGAHYEYRLHMDAFADLALREKPDMICCENPTNPTGKAVPLPDLRTLLHAAAKVGAALVIDEAYGDYLPMEASAVCLLPEAASLGVDLYVTRSMSKGFGLAGIRMGYVIGPAYGISQLGKLVTPFNCNSLARALVRRLFERCPDYLDTLIDQTAQANRRLYAELAAMGGKYLVADTSETTPLCVLSAPDAETDLARCLARAGLGTVSCATYENMGKNSVRLMLCRDLDRLLALLRDAPLS